MTKFSLIKTVPQRTDRYFGTKDAEATAVEQAFPTPDPRYVFNNKGQPIFASVLLTLDHLLDSDPLHVHQKCVYSTQMPDEALVALMKDYYQDSNLLTEPGTLDAILKLRASPDNCFALYFVPVTTTDRRGGMIAQVVMSTIALHRLMTHPAFGDGSDLLAIDRLVHACSTLAAKASQMNNGKLPPLLVMELTEGNPAEPPHVHMEDLARPAPSQPQPQDKGV